MTRAPLVTGGDRVAPQAWALHTQLSMDELNVHLPALETAGLLGIAEQDGCATAYLAARRDGLAVPGRWEPVPDRDWNEAWKQGLEPVRVGVVTVAPPWAAPPRGLGGRLWVVIEPGQAFGTGHHDTTKACLAAMQDGDLRGRRVLDVGTGSGVLAVCAARLGAARVVAVDTDPLAVEAATANAAANAVRPAVRVRHGSVEAARPGLFDLVVANLDTATLAALAGRLAARLVPSGTLVASGVSLEREAQARDALTAAGLRTQVRQVGEWVVFVARGAARSEASRPPRSRPRAVARGLDQVSAAATGT
ncbi:MAG TPA: 50S ribosomal protein L11 methyltransferase [Egibacteraceae bacterium]|nr:50S ribosomal protein L11 methyltransferase [Egibacteraceae bacterium]